MAERITEERLIDLRIAHAECEPDDQCDGADLLAEVDRLRDTVARHEQTLRGAIATAERARELEGVIGEIRELHHLVWLERPERVIGEADDPFCDECSVRWPCPTVKLLPSTDDEDGANG